MKEQHRKGFPGSGQLNGPKHTVDLPVYDSKNMSGKIVEVTREYEKVSCDLPVYDSKNMSGKLQPTMIEKKSEGSMEAQW